MALRDLRGRLTKVGQQAATVRHAEAGVTTELAQLTSTGQQLLGIWARPAPYGGMATTRPVRSRLAGLGSPGSGAEGRSRGAEGCLAGLGSPGSPVSPGSSSSVIDEDEFSEDKL